MTNPAVVDADGHILEPTDLWERYLEPQYRCLQRPGDGTARTYRTIVTRRSSLDSGEVRCGTIQIVIIYA